MKKVLLGLALLTASAFAEVRTISGELISVAKEADLNATEVLLTNGGGVHFTQTLTLSNTYTFDGTGVLSVASGKTLTAKKANVLGNTLGHTLVKDGPGTLLVGDMLGVVNIPTRWIVKQGIMQNFDSGSMYGNHSTTTTNLTIEVLEGATLKFGYSHSPMGPLVLTGGNFDADVAGNNATWGNVAFKGGVVAHPSTTPSLIRLRDWAHLNHCNTDCTFTVDAGARLIVDGILRDGQNQAANAFMNCVLIKDGGGELILTKAAAWTGGTKLRGGIITVSDPKALGNGTLRVEGDATISVLPGCQFVCPPLAVSGTHTLTFVGDGTVTLPEGVPAGLTVVNQTSGLRTSPIVGNTLYLNGGDLVVDVPAGETQTVTAIDSSLFPQIRVNLTKTGGGTLVLPNQDNTSYLKEIKITGGLIQMAAANNFGVGDVTIAGGGLRVAASFTPNRKLIFNGSGSLDIAEGKALTVSSNYFHTVNATIDKTGAGDLILSGKHYPLTSNNMKIHAFGGTVQLGGDFSNHAGFPTQSFEMEEGTKLISDTTHVPMGNVTLRGAKMVTSSYLNTIPQADNASGLVSAEFERVSRWNGFSLNGTITVEPSPNQIPSRIESHYSVALAHANYITTFDVKAGAVLEVDALLQPGENAGATAVQTTTLVKDGAGELVLKQPCGADNLVFNDGTITLEKFARFASSTKLVTSPHAKFKLLDGAVLPTGFSTASPTSIAATADVWMDASRLTAEDGASVESVPNLGASGGSFSRFTWSGNGFTSAGVPRVKRNSINGLPTLFFNGSQALALTTYTNRTQHAHIFFVAKAEKWTYNVGHTGYWSGPMSLGNFTMTGDDNNCSECISWQHNNSSYANFATFATGGFNATYSNMAVERPYLLSTERTPSAKITSTYTSAAANKVTQSGTISSRTYLDLTLVAIGGRLTTGGAPQVKGTAVDAYGYATNDGNRMFVGQLGEVLVFTRSLSEAEVEAIEGYLRHKWFNGPDPSAGQTAAEVGQFTIEVPEEATAAVAGGVRSSASGGSAAFTKTGAGALELAGQFAAAGGSLDVDQGSVDFVGSNILSRAQVWFDATDASTLTLSADNTVLSVRNKGSLGGDFGQCPGAGSTPVPLPKYVAESPLNNLPAVVFDNNSVLKLPIEHYTTTNRNVHIYAVMQRAAYNDQPGLGRWNGAYSVNSTVATGEGATAIHIENPADKTLRVSSGNDSYSVTMPFSPSDMPHLLIQRSMKLNTWFGIESATKRHAWSFKNPANGKFDFNFVLVGGRSDGGNGGRAQWSATNNTNNRMWSGHLGEFILFYQPLPYAEEKALLAYLRKKWLNVGTASSEPPAVLSGNYGPAAVDNLGLSMDEGTTLVSSAPSFALSSIESGANVTWVRDWRGALEGFAFGDVAGTMSFGPAQTLQVVTAPEKTAKLFGGSHQASLENWTIVGDDTSDNSLKNRQDGIWLVRACGTMVFFR